jgi:hypothetical protein
MLLAGCATTIDRPQAFEAESISYELGPCFGTCPVYAVTVRPDGSGTFEGKRFTAVAGMRSFTMTPATYRAFAAALATYEPNGERLVQPGTPDCRNAPTDMPSVDVRWTRLSGANNHLAFYKGCRIGNEALAEALSRAPDLLPIAAMIGKR